MRRNLICSVATRGSANTSRRPRHCRTRIADRQSERRPRRGGDGGLDKGARLGPEDRGSEPNQLRAPFHAAVTGDDRVDESYFAPRSERRGTGECLWIFDDANNVGVALSRGFTPLHIAAVFGHLDLIRELIARGANPALIALEGSSVLHQAVYGGNLPVVKYFVEEAKIDVNVRQYDGCTPIIWAYQRAYSEIITYLRQHGAAIDVHIKGGWSVLTEAIRSGNAELVRAVLDETSPDLADLSVNGIGPLNVACRYAYRSIAELLVGERRRRSFSRQEWNFASCRRRGTQSVGVDPQLFVAKGAEVNAAQPTGTTPLIAAAGRRSPAMTEALLDLKADPDPPAGSSTSALITAVQEGRDETVRLLVARGADPNFAGEDEWTALHHAAYRGDLASVSQLLSRSQSKTADPSPRC